MDRPHPRGASPGGPSCSFSLPLRPGLLEIKAVALRTVAIKGVHSVRYLCMGADGKMQGLVSVPTGRMRRGGGPTPVPGRRPEGESRLESLGLCCQGRLENLCKYGRSGPGDCPERECGACLSATSLIRPGEAHTLSQGRLGPRSLRLGHVSRVPPQGLPLASPHLSAALAAALWPEPGASAATPSHPGSSLRAPGVSPTRLLS